MKNLTIFLLLFFIHCNSQQKITDKKYMDMEIALQKYRDIKAKYDSLVEKNKNDLIYKDGGYYQNTVYEKENTEKIFNPLKSEAKFFLTEANNEIFIVNNIKNNYISVYTYQGKKLVEEAYITDKKDQINSINNLMDNTSVKYFPDKSTHIFHYETDDLSNSQVILEKKYMNDELIWERNYKKDFKVNKEQMLSKLPDNFYDSAMKYIKEEKFKNDINYYNLTQAELEEFQKRIKELKVILKTAIETKNDFYKEIKINKNYIEAMPIYNLYIPLKGIGFWWVRIDAKTNEIFEIKLSIPID